MFGFTIEFLNIGIFIIFTLLHLRYLLVKWDFEVNKLPMRGDTVVFNFPMRFGNDFVQEIRGKKPSAFVQDIKLVAMCL